MLQPKPKERRRIPVPLDLRDGLTEAFQLIKESRSDPDVRIDFDDAIQVGRLCGGKVGDKRRPFEFSYYPEGITKARWELAFHPLEIEDIVDGRDTELTLYCCTTPDCEFKSNNANSYCHCDYVEDPYFGSFSFPVANDKLVHWNLPAFTSSTTRQDIIDVLGPPGAAGEACEVHGIKIPVWIKYYRDDCQVHFQFGRRGQLQMVSFMEPDWDPDKIE